MNRTPGEKAAVEGLRRWYRELTDKAREVKKIINDLGGDVEDDIPRSSSETPDEVEVSSPKPQQVVERYLRDHRTVSFRPRQLARQIVTDGYEPFNIDNWPTQVSNCLKRAVRKGRIETEDREGKTWYRWKQNADGEPDGGNQGEAQS